jgi:GxxExxY protein
MNENAIGRTIVDVAVRLHRDLGPGLLESVYELIMADELTRQGLAVERQKPMAIEYRGRTFGDGFRADLVIEGKVIVEMKSVEILHNAHRKQLLTYLKLTGLKLGYLLNFGAPLMKHGIVRTVNELG